MWFVPPKTIWGEILTHSKGKEPLWNRWAGRVFTLTLFIFKAADFFFFFWLGASTSCPCPRKKSPANSCALACSQVVLHWVGSGTPWVWTVLQLQLCISASAPLHLHLCICIFSSHLPVLLLGLPSSPGEALPPPQVLFRARGGREGKLEFYLFGWFFK